MKARTVVLALATLFVAVAVCVAADDVNMGTWKLDEAKSKIAAGGGKNETVVYAMDGDNVKVTVDGVDAKGNPTHSEWTGKYDGKDYPVTGDPDIDMRSYRRVNAHTLSITQKKEGKVTSTIRIVVAADGKSRTVTNTSIDASGKKTASTSVYDKQ
jgi:outer membrane protein assembly factor BamE (lipoprotein component of BamABCDE complex)